MLRVLVSLIAAACMTSAERLRVFTDCPGNICISGQAVLSVDIAAPNVGKNHRLTLFPGVAQPPILFTPTAAGRWNVAVNLDLGRNIVTVRAVDSDQGSIGMAVAYFQPDDARANLLATGFFGISLDSFAASALNTYINPDQNGKIKERGVGGVTFEYRLLGDLKWVKRSQLWVYGEAVHGVRSAGLECSGDLPQGVCVSFDPAKPNRTLYMIRASTSLEAFVGTRWEMFSLQSFTNAPAALYTKAQAGLLGIAGSGGDLIDVHHVAVGVTVKAGMFTGSYFEAGLGKTALFPRRDSFPRMKVDAYVQWPLFGQRLQQQGMTGFVQMTVDSNPRNGGADSVQTYFGINFDLRTLF